MASKRAGVIGIDATLRSLDRLGVSMDAEIAAAVSKTADGVLETAEKSIRKKKRGKKEAGRWVSPPGKPPNTDSGKLLRSLGIQKRGTEADVYSDDFKAPLLEFGTQSMPARPFLQPALQKNRFVFYKRLREVVKLARIKAGK